MQGQQDFGRASREAGELALLRTRADLRSGEGPLSTEGPSGAATVPEGRLQGGRQGGVDARWLGKYQLIASLGRGGMADVLLALVSGPAGFNKLTVLKILREDLKACSADAVQLFVAEARLAARFSHPNVVRTYEAAEIDGRYLLAMEYLEGQTYRHVQRRAAKTCGLLLHEHLRILSQLARGLEYVHGLTDYDGAPLSMVHRDVSPQNVFVTYDGEVKLLDFGIAQTRESERPAQNRVIKGKLDYMAPEQLMREPLDARADVFALGAMLWEAISGARFAGGRTVSDFAKAQARVHGGETNIRAVQPGVPARLAAIVDHALALDPAQRLPDAGGFADAIDAYLAEVGAPSVHSLPGLMSSLFEHERRKLRALVERHLQRARSEQVEAEEHTGERVCFRIAEVETSGWTAVRDLSGRSGSDGPDVDEPTRPRAQVLRPPSKTPPVSRKSKVGPALLMAFGALSGGALAWFGPGADSDSRAHAPEISVGPARAPSSALATVGGGAAEETSALVAEPTRAPLAEPASLRSRTEEPRASTILRGEPTSALLAESAPGGSASSAGESAPDEPLAADSVSFEARAGTARFDVVPQLDAVPPQKPSALAAPPHKAAPPAAPVASKAKTAAPAAPILVKPVVERNPYLR